MRLPPPRAWRKDLVSSWVMNIRLPNLPRPIPLLYLRITLRKRRTGFLSVYATLCDGIYVAKVLLGMLRLLTYGAYGACLDLLGHYLMMFLNMWPHFIHHLPMMGMLIVDYPSYDLDTGVKNFADYFELLATAAYIGYHRGC